MLTEISLRNRVGTLGAYPWYLGPARENVLRPKFTYNGSKLEWFSLPPYAITLLYFTTAGKAVAGERDV
jgi:hypothetical protein